MPFSKFLADTCGVSIQTVDRWIKSDNFPKYSQVIKSHLWNGEVYYSGWENYRFSGSSIVNKRTGHFITKSEIDMLWVLRQQLQYKYEILTKSKNLDFDLILEKIDI